MFEIGKMYKINNFENKLAEAINDQFTQFPEEIEKQEYKKLIKLYLSSYKNRTNY